MHAITPLPPWASRRAAMTNAFDSLVPTRTALLVIDLQNSFLASERSSAARFGLPILPNVNRLIETSRAGGMAIIFLRHTVSDAPDRDLPAWQKAAAEPILAARRQMVPGSQGHQIHAGVNVAPGDLVVDKYRQSAFARGASELEQELKTRGIDTLIITGAMTNACCEATARDGFDLGFRVFFISDATAALSDEEHNASLLNLAICCADVRNTASMASLISASAGASES